MMKMMKCGTSVRATHSHCLRVVTLFMTFLLLHSSSITPYALSQAEDPEEPPPHQRQRHTEGNFHFKCSRFISAPPTKQNDGENPGDKNSSVNKTFIEMFEQQLREKLEREEETKRVINDALKEIDNISRGRRGSLCNSPSKMYKMFPNVTIGTHLFQVPKGKADLIAYFLQLSREKTKSAVWVPLDDHELNGIFNSLSAESQLESIQFVEDIKPQSHNLHFKESRDTDRMKKTKSTEDINNYPWYFNPNKSPTPIPMDEKKFVLDQPSNKGNEAPQYVKGYWTWPYFECDEKNRQGEDDTHVNKSLNGKWLVSYSVPFLLGKQPGTTPSSSTRAYGLLSFNVDLTKFPINQCDFTPTQTRNGDLNANPLHVFRETHKCDRKTTTCEPLNQRIPTGWLKGNYVCKCNHAHFALYKKWNNTVQGVDAESNWCTSWRGNETEGESFLDVVSCRPCPYGCPDCIEKHTCMADMNSTLRLALLCVSVLCTLSAVGFIVVVCKYRRISVFKTSSPIFMCIMLSGCIIMYSEMIALYPVLTIASCIAVKWTRHLGFCITYTALALKLCRVYLTFRVKSAHKIKLTEKHLLHWMSPIMVIMLLYLFAWTISDPPDLEMMRTVDDKRFYQCVYNWWDHALAIGEVIFLAYGVWICWKIRENPDAQFISYSIYNIALVNVVMVSLHLLIVPKAGPDMKYVLAFVRTQFSTTTTIGLVIGSKLIRVWRGETSSLKEIANSANGFGQDTLDLGEENLQLKEELQKMATQIEKLKFYAMCKNNPHLKQSSVNITNAEMDFGRLDSFSTL